MNKSTVGVMGVVAAAAIGTVATAPSSYAELLAPVTNPIDTLGSKPNQAIDA